ncbi:MAG: hypothetical protein AB7O52_11285 [Planctomycetota bacterium]
MLLALIGAGVSRYHGDDPPVDDSDLQPPPAAPTLAGSEFVTALLAADALCVEPDDGFRPDFSPEAEEPVDWEALRAALEANRDYFAKLDECLLLEDVSLTIPTTLDTPVAEGAPLVRVARWMERRVQWLLHVGETRAAVARALEWHALALRLEQEAPPSLLLYLVTDMTARQASRHLAEVSFAETSTRSP